MSGFYMECCSQVKWVKREHSISQVLNLSLPNVPKEVLLTVLKIQAKTPSHSGGSVLREGSCMSSLQWRKVKGYSA